MCSWETKYRQLLLKILKIYFSPKIIGYKVKIIAGFYFRLARYPAKSVFVASLMIIKESLFLLLKGNPVCVSCDKGSLAGVVRHPSRQLLGLLTEKGHALVKLWRERPVFTVYKHHLYYVR